jgi:hypothetical protein
MERAHKLSSPSLTHDLEKDRARRTDTAVTSLVRWTILAVGLVGVGAGVYLHAFAPDLLGRGRSRAWNLLVVPCGLLMAAGAWYQVWVGWAGALVLCGTELADTVAGWKRRARHGAHLVKAVTIVWGLLVALLIMALVTRPGREAFGLVGAGP